MVLLLNNYTNYFAQRVKVMNDVKTFQFNLAQQKMSHDFILKQGFQLENITTNGSLCKNLLGCFCTIVLSGSVYVLTFFLSVIILYLLYLLVITVVELLWLNSCVVVFVVVEFMWL